MREALNNNPLVQVAVVGVLIVIVGLFMMMNLKKKDEGGASSSNTSTTEASLTTPQGSVDLNVQVTPTDPSATAGAISPTTGVAPSTGTVSPEALIPGPGLPAQVVDAWKGGDAVVLLIVRGGGIDDRLVRRSVASLSGDSGVSVFVTRAKDVARYSRITQGVGVDRAPALVVVRPRKQSGSVPEAQVSYGFRNSQGVVQAVHDALYTGRDNLPYSPR